MERPVDKVQTGPVIFLGICPDATGALTISQQSVKITSAGVDGNYKSLFVATDEEKLPYLTKNALNLNLEENIKAGKLPFYQHQICIVDTHTRDLIREKGFSYDFGYGKEQLVIDHVDLNALHRKSLIKIGTVVLEVIASKTTCSKFFTNIGLTKWTPPILTEVVFDLLRRPGDSGHAHQGVLARVLQPGTIHLGDIAICEPPVDERPKPLFGPNIPILPTKFGSVKQSMFLWLTEEEAIAEYPGVFHSEIRSAFRTKFKFNT